MKPTSYLYIAPLLLCMTLLSLQATATGGELQSQVLSQPGRGEMPLSPYLDYYIDESLSMDIEEAAAPGLASSYRPFSLENLPRTEGITWLRFTISPLPPETKPATFLLDMGQSIPGTPVLYDPERNELSGALEWHENLPAHRNILLLPEEGRQPVTCYIKLDGLPGPWFFPMIRTPQNAASTLLGLSRTGAILALAVVMLLCLLRGASERGQWRVWTGLYVAVALVQALLGMPASSQTFSIASLAATLLPGIALMLLPHVGRHLLNTPAKSRNLDIQLFLLSLPGAAFALLPLVPGWHWLDRWLDLWPAGTIIFIPTALGAWIGGLPGSKRFILACLIPPIFTAFAWAGIDFGIPANFLSSLPLWGVAISALLLVTSGAQGKTAGKAPGKASKEKAMEIQAPLNPPQEEPVINLENPLGDPHLRLVVPTATEDRDAEEEQSKTIIPVEKRDINWLQARENALREPLDEILRQGSALAECSLPPAVRQYAEQMISQAGNMADIMSGALPQHLMEKIKPEEEKTFNLQRLLRDVHNSIAPGAEGAGTALSWYMPPHLARMFKGRPEELKATLGMLLESAVRASRNGSVHLTARRVPESPEEGHILFSITDNGSGVPPRERSTLAIARAWELIGKSGGYLAMEASPTGVSVALSMRFTPVAEEEDETSTEIPALILAGEDAGQRRSLQKILAELPYKIVEAGSMQEVLDAQSRHPVPLLLAIGDMARPSSADMTAKFSDLAHQAGYLHCNILAITDDDSQWELLKPSGFTHAMIRGSDAESIRKTVSDLLENLVSINPNVVMPSPDAPENVATEKNGQTGPSSEEQHNEVSETKTGNADFEKASASESPFLKMPDTGDNEPSFEGPEWLSAMTAREIAQETEARSIPSTVQEGQKAGQSASPQIENEKSDPDDTVSEWVGEPVPIPREDGQAGREAAVPSTVGKEEQNPEARKPEKGNESKSESGAGSFLNFIVGVKQKFSGSPEPEAAHLPPEAPGKNPASMPAPSAPEQEIKAPVKTEEFILQEDNSAGTDAQENEDPVLMALVDKLDKAMRMTREAFEHNDAASVASATNEMALASEKVGLRLLSRMAGCVERAARQRDLQAVADLLPDLETAVERNRIALTQKPIKGDK